MKTKLKLTFSFLLVFLLAIQISCKSESSDNPAAPVPKVSAPTFTPASGTEFVGSQEIILACETAGAEIRYTTDGTTPTDTVGTVYSVPFTITVNTSVKAVAYKAEMTTSDVATANYTKAGSVANPSFTPIDGSTFTGSQEITITTTTLGATIKYTLDNTDPKTSGTAITGTAGTSSATFIITATKTIKAYAYKSGMENSVVVTATITRSYTVTYDGNGNLDGSVPATQTQAENTTITVRANTGNLVRIPAAGTAEAYKFGGWQTVSGGVGGTYYPAGTGTFTLTGNITLYARWVKFELRDTGPGGGLIFYDRGSYSGGWRYLEAAPADESGIYQWKTSNTSTPGTSTAVGTGYTNTYTAMTGVTHPAAEVVRNATHGGYSGWFLPSRDELTQMYVNLKQQGVGGFAYEVFWSSSDYSSYYAWGQDFNSGFQGSFNKSSSNRVRAVRAF